MSFITHEVDEIEQFVANTIHKLGDWIEGPLQTAEKIYNDLEQVEQQAAQWAYGIVAIFNSNLKTVENIIPLIQKQFPNLSIDVVHGFLEKMLNDVNAVQAETPLTLEDAVKAFATYLEGTSGTGWASVSASAGHVLLTLLSPQTPLQKAVAISEYVYQVILKPVIQLLL